MGAPSGSRAAATTGGRRPIYSGTDTSRRRLDPDQRHEALLAELKAEPTAAASLRDLQFIGHANRAGLSKPEINRLLRDEHRVRLPRLLLAQPAASACVCVRLRFPI